MKVDEGWADYGERTQKLSDVTRQLAFAGIALLWIFSNGGNAPEEAVELPGRLHAPAFLLIATLFLDLLHQTYSAAGVRIFTRRAENSGTVDFKYPDWFPVPAEIIFVAKVVSLAAAYVWLFVSLAQSWL